MTREITVAEIAADTAINHVQRVVHRLLDAGYRPPDEIRDDIVALGKTTLGSWVCKELGLEFLDLAGVDLERLPRVVGDTAADVVELPWALPYERRALALVRKVGASLVLWAHSEDMQARSDGDEPLFREDG